MNIKATLLAPVLAAFGGFISTSPAAQDGQTGARPFSAYLTTSGDKEVTVMKYGSPVPLARETTQVQEGDFTAARSALTTGGAPIGWQTTVLSSAPDAAYRVERLQFTGGTADMEVSYPLEATLYPLAWEFSKDSGDARCDIILYDSKETPKAFDEAYGINKIPQDAAKIPEGTPVLRVRILFAAPGVDGIKDFHPVIHTDAAGRRLVIPVPSENADIRVLFFPEKYRQTSVSTVKNLDATKTTLRFAGVDDHYQFGTEGALAVKREIEDGPSTMLSAGLAYYEEPEPTGQLVAFCDFESLEDNETPVLEANLQATVSDGRLVDAGVLDGKALYLGQRRVPSTASLTIPADLRQSFTQDQMTISFWIKLPWGQLGKHPLVFWPYRRGAEGLKEPFAVAGWWMGEFGPLVARINRWDASDDLVLAGFSHKLNALTSLKLVPPGWNHVALAVRDDIAKVYLNGELKSEITMPGPVTSASLQKGGALELFKNLWGTIDKVRLHDFALSQKQIVALIKGDLPKTLLHYPLEIVADGFTPATPGGDFPVDAWSWDDRDFKPEETFAARADGAESVAGESGKALRLGPGGIIVPPKALMDLGIDRFALAFWFRSDKPTGPLLTSNNHPKHGFTFKFQPKKIQGVLCGNYQITEAPAECPPGEWHHFAFCYDNKRLRMFLDGEKIQDGPFIPKEKLNLGAGLVLGAGLEGEVADLRVLGRMIDTDDVQELMKLRNKLPDTNQ